MKSQVEKKHFEQHLLASQEVLDKEEALAAFVRECLYFFCLLKKAEKNFDVEKVYTLLTNKVEETALLMTEGNFYPDEIDKIRFILCTALDEALAHYIQQKGLSSYSSLTTYYYREQLGGEHLFNILEEASRDVRLNLPMLCLGHKLLCLGFMGQYALKENGLIALGNIKDRVFALIKKAVPQKKVEKVVKDSHNDARVVRRLRTTILPLMLVITACTYGVAHQRLVNAKQGLHALIKANLQL